MKTKVHKNGKPQGASMLDVLEEQLTVGYKSSLPLASMYGTDGLPLLVWRRDIEFMLRHPVVAQTLSYFKGGIAGAEFWGGSNPDDSEDEQGLPICAQNSKVGLFIKEQCERFWDRGVPHLQAAYEYGWAGCENVYDDDDGVLKWKSLHHFSPADVFLLTCDKKPVGVRVKNVENKDKPVDLWGCTHDIPAKGLWYAHQPRYDHFYGESQLLGAWRPWRRAAWKDGAESVIDMACYRFGVGWVIPRYPDEDLQGPSGSPNTTLDSQGKPRRYARDIMRQIAEQAKAGAAVGLPSKRDKDGNYLYDIEVPQTTLSGFDNLIAYLKHLYDQITQGIGVPPELLQAADSGSGYSGRRIPLEAFLSNQQHIADAMLKLFVENILRPLVRWNFGDAIRFNVQVKSLIKTRTKQAQAAGPQQNPQPGQPAPNQAMFSHNLVTDRVREIARKIVRAA